MVSVSKNHLAQSNDTSSTVETFHKNSLFGMFPNGFFRVKLIGYVYFKTKMPRAQSKHSLKKSKFTTTEKPEHSRNIPGARSIDTARTVKYHQKFCQISEKNFIVFDLNV